ncbi:MAG: Tll0287-like domain-containing protein [Pseudohaliea sp.]
MNYPKLTAALAASLLAATPGLAGDVDPRQAEARSLVKRFVGTVKPLLTSTIQEQGPVAAIEVCAERAPALADQLSEETGWSVGRVSLKPRNTERAQPDAWEREQLERFAARAADGEPGPMLNHGEVVDGRYRYMQAQPVGGVCLVCHGESIEPAVAEAIRHYYPDDRATGYQLGEIRGAITLTAPPESTGP